MCSNKKKMKFKHHKLNRMTLRVRKQKERNCFHGIRKVKVSHSKCKFIKIYTLTHIINKHKNVLCFQCCCWLGYLCFVSLFSSSTIKNLLFRSYHAYGRKVLATTTRRKSRRFFYNFRFNCISPMK